MNYIIYECYQCKSQNHSFCENLDPVIISKTNFAHSFKAFAQCRNCKANNYFEIKTTHISKKENPNIEFNKMGIISKFLVDNKESIRNKFVSLDETIFELSLKDRSFKKLAKLIDTLPFEPSYVNIKNNEKIYILSFKN